MGGLRDIDHSAAMSFLADLETKSFDGTMVNSAFGGYGYAGNQSSRAGGSLRFLLPGAQYDYEAQAGELWLNSAVAICLRWLKTNFPEPKLVVDERVDATTWKPIDHDVLNLLDTCNPAYGSDVLWGAAVLSGKVNGNAYLIKAKSLAGSTKELWYAPHWQMFPRWRDGSHFIDYYDHIVDGARHRLEVDQVVHLREGIDPLNLRYGMSDLKSTLREICTDNQASTYEAAILRNSGVPGLMISFTDPNVTVDKDERDEFSRAFRAKFTGEKSGDPMVVNSGIKVDKVGYSPKELSLDTVRNVPESRICGAIGLDPMTVGLTVGAGQRKYANYQEARRAGYHDCLIPLQKMWAKQLQKQLAVDFPDLADTRKRRLRWDYSEVEALQDDQDAKSTRVSNEYKSGIRKLDEARSSIGLAPIGGEAGEAFFKAPTPQPQMAVPPNGEDGAVPFAKKLVSLARREMASFQTKAKAKVTSTNEYGLPDGAPLRKQLQKWIGKQAAQVIGDLPGKSAGLPDSFASLTDYDDPMASAMTPILQVYWDKAGGQIKESIGLDIDTWQVTDPNVKKAIEKQSLSFCETTNKSTHLTLEAALAKLKEELIEGIINEGEAIPILAKRVSSIFGDLTDNHAELIAQTETSRAIHAASEMSAMDTEPDVVDSKHWLLTSDACPICQGLYEESEPDGIKLGTEFGTVGSHSEYSSVRMPPAHPRCRCTVVFQLSKRYMERLPEDSKVQEFIQVSGD
jgi:HK97 family phage portal protein